jgi:hypothetical protein
MPRSNVFRRDLQEGGGKKILHIRRKRNRSIVTEIKDYLVIKKSRQSAPAFTLQNSKTIHFPFARKRAVSGAAIIGRSRGGITKPFMSPRTVRRWVALTDTMQKEFSRLVLRVERSAGLNNPRVLQNKLEH